ncbi:MAG: hypothetical protein U5K76_10925 [Woeseiaceae bacterium]|nr:hypothetical protein [Woeseiaceae bacterium]
MIRLLPVAMLLASFAGPASAGIDSGALPGDAIWYLHADVAGMRDERGGTRPLQLARGRGDR